jgi:hypothetical protein
MRMPSAMMVMSLRENSIENAEEGPALVGILASF